MQFNARRQAFAKDLGKPNRLLLGLGSTDAEEILRQKVQIDIFDVYLTGLGPHNSWRGWNKPDGEYLRMRLREAASVGAVPMLTLYQIAAAGEGNLAVLGDTEFMRTYWGDFHKLMTLLRDYGKPVLLNIEPDFWGYTHRRNPDPTQHFAHVGNVYDGCGQLGNSVSAIAQCMVLMTRKYAPQAKIGFPPSGFHDLISKEVAYMKKLGIDDTDFAVIQTGDRDAGCYEVGQAPCDNSKDPVFMTWDERNQRTPNFQQHFDYASRYARTTQLPLVWWQTALGAPSEQAGGRPFAYRDVKVRYFLTHASQMVDAGGVAAVFSPGEKTQTNLKTDGGQFKRLSDAYFASPAQLP